MTTEEIRREAALTLAEAIKTAASDGTLRVDALPIIGKIHLSGLPREVVEVAQALQRA